MSAACRSQGGGRGQQILIDSCWHLSSVCGQQGCSGNFFLIWGNGFRDLGPSNGGACAPRTAVGVDAGGVVLRGPGGVTPGIFKNIFDAKSRIWAWGQFEPENKLIEGQPNEYDVICRNASVLALHLWPTIFAGAPFRLQNICRNGVPPRSRTITPVVGSGQRHGCEPRRIDDDLFLLCCGVAASHQPATPSSAAAAAVHAASNVTHLISPHKDIINYPWSVYSI